MKEQLKEYLFEYCLRLADSSIILAQRLGEWCGHGPILEEDIALTNISLDLLGQARAFYSYAGEVEGLGRTEDDLAFQRDERQYKNALLVEQPNGDFGQTMIRQFFFSAYQYYFYQELMHSADPRLAALAEKSLKEVTYHLRHSSEWILRLGLGTEESHRRVAAALDDLWRFTGDLFDADETDRVMVAGKTGVDLAIVRTSWDKKVKEVFTEASLTIPENTFMITGSRQAKHTEALGHLLAEMQSVHRAFPGAGW